MVPVGLENPAVTDERGKKDQLFMEGKEKNCRRELIVC